MSLTTRSAPTPDSEYPYHLVFHDPKSEYRHQVQRSHPKIGSLDNVGHQPGGGKIRIVQNQPKWLGKSKIGSLDNASHEPGGGNVKIYTDPEHKKRVTMVQSKVASLEKLPYIRSGGNVKVQEFPTHFSAQPKIESRNPGYVPKGGDKMIYHDLNAQYMKQREKAQALIGSLQKVNHVPGGGNTRVYKEKLQWHSLPKIGSLENAGYRPGGGAVQIHNEKPRWASDSKIGSMENAQHQPKGGNVKIFNDKVEWNSSSKIHSFDNIHHKRGYGYIFKENKYDKDFVDYDRGLFKRKRWWEGVKNKMLGYAQHQQQLENDTSNST